jgi:hypothetical protein
MSRYSGRPKPQKYLRKLFGKPLKIPHELVDDPDRRINLDLNIALCC